MSELGLNLVRFKCTHSSEYPTNCSHLIFIFFIYFFCKTNAFCVQNVFLRLFWCKKSRLCFAFVFALVVLNRSQVRTVMVANSSARE